MSDELTFASAGVAGIHYAKCWGCMLNQCPGGWHSWADADDIDHAAKTGQPDPSDKRCGCPCAEGPELVPEYGEDDSDHDDSLFAGPCVECGSQGACAYDSEGRPMIHANWLDEEDA